MFKLPAFLFTAISLFVYSVLLMILSLSVAYAEPIRANSWDISLGLGVTTEPKSEAYKSHKQSIVPVADIQWREFLFLNTDSGFGVRFYQDKDWILEASINYDEGRKEVIDKENLKGLGDIDGTPTFNINIKLDIEAADIYASASKYIRTAGGIKAKFGMESLIPIRDFSQSKGSHKRNKQIKEPELLIDVAMIWADTQYNYSIFGVSQKQSDKSGLRQNNIKGSFNSAEFKIGLLYPLDKYWSLNAILGHNYWLGSAAKSPIVRNKSSLNGGVFLLYEF